MHPLDSWTLGQSGERVRGVRVGRRAAVGHTARCRTARGAGSRRRSGGVDGSGSSSFIRHKKNTLLLFVRSPAMRLPTDLVIF